MVSGELTSLPVGRQVLELVFQFLVFGLGFGGRADELYRKGRKGFSQRAQRFIREMVLVK